jgi:hypothetical protein
LQSALQFLRQENSRIQIRGAALSDTWLNEPLLPPSKVDTPQAIVEGKRAALVSDLRNFMSSCQIVSVKEIEIGGRGWKSTKTTAAHVVRKQQESYRRLCVRKDLVLENLKVDH